MKWQYFGSEEGILNQFPASRAEDCTSYDHRFRYEYQDYIILGMDMRPCYGYETIYIVIKYLGMDMRLFIDTAGLFYNTSTIYSKCFILLH